jgi:hypothetical protein
MKKIVLSLLCFSFSYAYADVRFLANSDLHVGADNGQSTMKLHQGDQMLARMIVYPDMDAVLLIGDLTDSATQPQLDSFIRSWMNPYKTIATLKVALCLGNHDRTGNVWYKPTPPAMSYIVKQSGGKPYYSFKLKELNFICCGLYPAQGDPTSCWCPCTVPWLESQLKSIESKTPGAPIVLFFHYSIVRPMSDWGAKGARDLFFNLIKNYNIVAIITGHNHDTYTHLWRNKIPLVCVGGEYFAECNYNAASGGINFDFYNKNGLKKDWDDPDLWRPQYTELEVAPA